MRQMALRQGELYMVTSPAFIGSNMQRIGQALVPTRLWKMAYSLRLHKAGVLRAQKRIKTELPRA